uniref:Uncharacterized protein n=1 Tax=Anguilla anguilla TaxID=7936 RepID=A0A0E9SQJ9_ANGAN
MVKFLESERNRLFLPLQHTKDQAAFTHPHLQMGPKIHGFQSLNPTT